MEIKLSDEEVRNALAEYVTKKIGLDVNAEDCYFEASPDDISEEGSVAKIYSIAMRAETTHKI